MLQKAFGFHEAQTAWVFLRSAEGGGRKKERKKEKRNEGGGTGLSTPEASASATSAAAESSDKGEQEPASLPPAPQYLPRHKIPFALCLGQCTVPADPVGTPSHGVSSRTSIPCPLCPRASSSDVAGHHGRCRIRCGWSRSVPELALVEVSPARWVPAHPISLLGFSIGTDHTKDARPQTRADAKPQGSGAGADASCSYPTLWAAGHRLHRM